MDVRDQLLHRFFPNGDVLGDFATITLQMDRVNQQEMTRRDFVAGNGKSARRDEPPIWFPPLHPRTPRSHTARHSNLLSHLLTFPPPPAPTHLTFHPPHPP